MSSEPDTALLLRQVSKEFGTVRALDDVTFRIRPGTVHALLGENGAGKTTLMRIAFGMVHADTGTVEVGGQALHLRSPADAIAAGIGMVHQHFTLVPAMTVAENIALGGRGLHHPRAAAERVRAIAHQTGFALDPDALVEALPVGAQQRVEIAKALARRARILVLDEPTAVLAPAEADDLLRWLRSYVMQGNAAVLSTHKLGEALAVADELTVLRQGRVVHRAARVDSSAELLTAAMIGESTWEPDAVVPVRSRPRPTRPMFSATQLTLCDEEGRVRLAGATFTIDSGELVGIAAVEGAGQRQLLRALAGRLDPAGGELVRPPVVGFVPEDRHHDAVLLERSLAENVALRGAGRRSGRVRWPAVRAHTESLMRAFDVRAPGARTSMRILSGGNQQKLVLARELDDGGDTEVRALIVENPTRGLDVRATADIHTRLRTARDRGTAVVVYSSDLDEVLGLASRVLVLYAGTLRESAPDRDTVGRAMLGLPL